MAEANDRTSRSHEGDADDMSFLLHHLLSSSSSAPNPISSDKGKEIPFNLPPPSQTTDAALAFAARRAVGMTPHSGPGWDIFCHVRTLANDDRSRPSQAHLLDRDRTASPVESSAASLVLPYSGEMKEGRSSFVDSSGDCDAASGKRRKAPSSSVEADFDEYECESEEGAEVSEEPKPAPTRTSSKRSRAAEVHNLSEKRRRSRINEKMKALQNLIPNSNKTDKASMLDEAIEYLKQLQLQVQMLSMKNGLSLHPMYLPGSLQPVQIPQMSMGFNAGNGSLHMNMGVGMLPIKQDPSMQTSFGLSNQSIPLNQPPLLPGMTNINTNSGAFSDLSQGHHGSFQLSAASGEIYKEDVIRQVDINQSYPTGGPSN